MIKELYLKDLVKDQEDESKEVTIHSWKKQTGEEINEGELLIEILLDKANIEIESPFHGTVKEIYFEEGEEVTLGDLLARIEVRE